MGPAQLGAEIAWAVAAAAALAAALTFAIVRRRLRGRPWAWATVLAVPLAGIVVWELVVARPRRCR